MNAKWMSPSSEHGGGLRAAAHLDNDLSMFYKAFSKKEREINKGKY